MTPPGQYISHTRRCLQAWHTCTFPESATLMKQVFRECLISQSPRQYSGLQIVYYLAYIKEYCVTNLVFVWSSLYQSFKTIRHSLLEGISKIGYVMTSKITSQHQEILNLMKTKFHHDIKHCGMSSKSFSWCKTYLMTSKSLSWRPKVQTHVITSKRSSWHQKHVMMPKSLS